MDNRNSIIVARICGRAEGSIEHLGAVCRMRKSPEYVEVLSIALNAFFFFFFFFLIYILPGTSFPYVLNVYTAVIFDFPAKTKPVFNKCV